MVYISIIPRIHSCWAMAGHGVQVYVDITMKAAKENDAQTAEQYSRESVRVARTTREWLRCMNGATKPVVIDVVILPSMAMKNGDLTCGNCNENGWTWLVILCDFTWDTCYVMVGEMWDTSGNLTVCCGNNMDFFWKKTYKMVIFDSYGSLPERKCQNMAWNIMELMMGSLTQKKHANVASVPPPLFCFIPLCGRSFDTTH